MAHAALLFSFNFCFKSVTKPTNSLHVSKSSLAKRCCPALRLPAIRSYSSEKPQPDRNLRDQTSTSGPIEEDQLECNHHSCKPLFLEEDLSTSNRDYDNWVCLENASDIVGSRMKAYHDKLSHQERLASNSWAGNFYKYYGKALAREPSNVELLIEYAEFVWKSLGNITVAAEMLEEALLLPDFADNVQVMGMYSYILWHTDD